MYAEVFIKTVNVVTSHCFAEDGTELFTKCAPHVQHNYFSTLQPIKVLIYGVVVAVPVVDAKPP